MRRYVLSFPHFDNTVGELVADRLQCRRSAASIVRVGRMGGKDETRSTGYG